MKNLNLDRQLPSQELNLECFSCNIPRSMTKVDKVDIYQPMKTSLNGTLPPLQQHSKGSEVPAIAVYLIFKSYLGI
jgi:hypothetical protein